MPSLPPLNVICLAYYSGGKNIHEGKTASRPLFSMMTVQGKRFHLLFSHSSSLLTQISWETQREREREREAAIAPSSHQHFQNRLTVRHHHSFHFLHLSAKNNVSSRAQIDNRHICYLNFFFLRILLTQALLICQEILQLPNYHTHAQIFSFFYILLLAFLSGQIAVLTYLLRKLLSSSSSSECTSPSHTKLRVKVYF
jgi:hypothetical protein